MAVEERLGGAVGDALFANVGAGFVGFALVAVAIYGLFVAIFGESKEDFIEAKSENKSIHCQGLIKDYYVTSDKYEIIGERIVIKKLLRDKSFHINDCDIEG